MDTTGQAHGRRVQGGEGYFGLQKHRIFTKYIPSGPIYFAK